jgi:hypothetical protein
VLVLLAVGAGACVSGVASAETVIGLGTSNQLIRFDSATPGTTIMLGNVTGLAAGETLLGIDQRPLTGQLAAIGSSNRVYFIDLVSLQAFPAGDPFSPVLDGVEHGIDFNPTVDRIRVVNANGQNRRLNPLNGTAVAPGLDTALTYVGGGVPRAVGTAYTNSVANAPLGSVRQLIIDSNTDGLGEVGSQAGGNASFNGGVVTPLGALGFATNDLVGFDISGSSGLALASLTDPVSNLTSLYSLNLNPGAGQNAASFIGGIGQGMTLRDIAIIPAPGMGTCMAAGALVLVRRRRTR